MTMATVTVNRWDLAYSIIAGVGSLSLATWQDGKPETLLQIGPFPAREAGKEIPAHLVAQGLFDDVKAATRAYLFLHMANMSAHQNSLGVSYPFRIGSDDKQARG